MFSLLITVVSIALVIALVAATMYLGGTDTLTQGQDEALAAQALNEMSQIRSALFTYQASEGRWPEALSDLTPKYMAQLPPGWGDGTPAEVAGKGVESKSLSAEEARAAAVCQMINQRLGNSSTPQCADIDSSFMGCCSSD